LNPVRDCLSIFLNGRPLQIRGEEAFLPLSEFLRRRQNLTGTKVVCAEGDCGACAVLVGRIRDGEIQYAAVNSCIQMMFQLDATHVVTVEGLRDGGELNPIQKSMVRCHGAQCGFCTPGFIVTLYALMQRGQTLDEPSLRRGLVGNLCRCTGYESILKAAMATDMAGIKTINQLYPPEEILAGLIDEEVCIEAGLRRFYKPLTVEQAVNYRAANPGCLIVGGATDIGVQINKGTRTPSVVMICGGAKELRHVSCDEHAIEIGAAATLLDLEHAAENHVPELAAFLQLFGSPLIRAAGTLAGNLVNASPIGDAICALFVLETQVELIGPAGRRSVAIENFYTGYRKTVLADDEIVTKVRFALPQPGETYKLYKISKRRDLDISSLAAAIWMRRQGKMISDIRIAMGGVAPLMMRMRQTEACLRGRAMSPEIFDDAAEAARREVTPISDVRGSAAYRRALAGNVILKFRHDLGEDSGANGQPDAPRPSSRREPVLRGPERAP
jgi:xanthine dehydrogenase small subunit